MGDRGLEANHEPACDRGPTRYPLLLELREVEGMEHPLDRVNEVFDRLENLRDE